MRQISAVCVLVFLWLAAVVSLAEAGRVEPQQDDGADSMDDNNLRASVYPTRARAPAVLRIEATIESSDDNHALEFVVNSPDYYRRSTVPLVGARSARVHSVEFRATPAGEYDVRVTLIDSVGDARATVVYRVTVIN